MRQRALGPRLFRFAFLAMSAHALAAQTIYDFANLPSNYFFKSSHLNIGGYYTTVVFGPRVTALSVSRFGGYNSAAFPPHTGDVVIWDAADPVITVSLSSPASSVGVWYASLGGISMRAYNQNGGVIASAAGQANSNGAKGSPLFLSVSSPGIRSVQISGTPGTFVLSSLSVTADTSHPPFFTGETALSGGIYYLELPNHTLFGYYGYLTGGWIYHVDLGYEYVVSANDGAGGVYFYDLASGHWLFTNTGSFPSLYDFTLNSWIYYFADTQRAGHYTTAPRYFVNFKTNQIFTM